jgi:hypothetical protein
MYKRTYISTALYVTWYLIEHKDNNTGFHYTIITTVQIYMLIKLCLLRLHKFDFYMLPHLI